MTNIDLSAVPTFYHKYIHLVNETEIPAALQQSHKNAISVLQEIPESGWDYRYAEGKWNIRETVQHLIDVERIFSYRALMFARLDPNRISGFDQEAFVTVSEASKRKKAALLEELDVVFHSTDHLFESFTPQWLLRKGVAGENEIATGALGYVIAGHRVHHLALLREKYMN